MNYLIPKGTGANHYRNVLIAALTKLSDEKPWRVVVKPYVKKRSLEQNAFLHAVPLRMICDETGHEIDEMKEYLMGQAYGWEEYIIMNVGRQRPLRTTSSLTTTEFKFFIEWVEAWAATQLGMIIPRPNETLEDI